MNKTFLVVGTATFAILTVAIGTLIAKAQTAKTRLNTSTIDSLDISRYMGRWYELARFDHPFERNMELVTANYSLNPNGTEETVKALTPVTAAAARERMLTEARIHWLYQSTDPTDTLEAELKARFATLPYRRPAVLHVDDTFSLKETALTERMALQQAKLVLGFRVAAAEPAGAVEAAQLMTTLWGGCVTSLLFVHVREELSLCYYCAASYDRYQGTLLVDSGVQEENAERTKTEVLKQLDAIREGNFSDEELEAARRALIQRVVSAADNPEALESYYIGQTVYDTYLTPDEKVSRILAVTKEDVCRAARLTHFDATYLLAPEEEASV
jgi:predicted Zn-dependent peptidase